MALEDEIEGAAPAEDVNQAPADPAPLSVDLNDDDDDAPAGSAEANADLKSKRSWKREMRAQLKTAQEEKAAYERQMHELRAEIAATRAIAQQRPAYQPPPQDRPDPVEAELESIQQQRQSVLVQLRAEGLTDAQAEKLQAQYYALERKALRTVAKAEAGSRGGERNEGGFSIEAQNAMMESDFPEALKTASRQQECRLEMVKLVEQGRPQNYATARAAAKIVNDKYTRKPSAPSDADRARHLSTPGRAGGSPGAQQFTPSKLHLNAARAFTQHRDDLSDEARVKIWLKGPGKRLGLGKK